MVISPLEHAEIRGGWDKEDIKKAAGKYRIGQSVRIVTVKSCDVQRSSCRNGVVRRAKIIAKYPYFALVELKSGIRETVNWTELLTEKRRRAR